MSNQEDNNQSVADGVEAFSRLEAAVEATLARVSSLSKELDQAQKKAREMEELLKRFSKGEEDPARLNTRLQELERENKDLLKRLHLGKEGVERLLARVRFLEEQG